MTTCIELNQGWEFRRLGPPAEAWQAVELPHSPFCADLDGRNHWFGLCEYRRTLELDAATDGTRCSLHLGAAMHTARVLLNDRELAVHRGGYLPFEVDLTEALRGSRHADLVLQLDNRENPDVPPGKPFDELDFCWFGGLYRTAELRLRPALHITDPVAAGAMASGGVFVRTTGLTDTTATLAVKTHVRNTDGHARRFVVQAEIAHRGRTLATVRSALLTAASGGAVEVDQVITLTQPALWSPEVPQLHVARITLLDEQDEAFETTEQTFGIRRIAFSRSTGFVLNGRSRRLRGTNRHQEMPGVGYAVPRAAQFRDARRIKEAGFDYVRVSHYPPSPDFLDACDELGLLVMNCIPGWQYLGGPVFREACYQAARDLVRRDRHHPCVVLWELSLNETAMDEEFMTRLHAIGHEEYPGDQMFTCGWIDRYDVFIHSRQHGQIHTWSNGDKALVIAEYGDWEYYARNEGFDQKTGAGVYDRRSNARQMRKDGERALLHQAALHAAALNDTLASPAVLDGQWAMFDYARGYDPLRAAVGVMDGFRLPKFSWHFYRSQRAPGERGAGWSAGPMVFIASHWLPGSNLRVTVFSNCEQVELRLNGAVVGRQSPALTASTQHLPHPPFVFDLLCHLPGELSAVGFIAGRPQAAHAVGTPGKPVALALAVDDLGIMPAEGASDVLLAHASLIDACGRLCVGAAGTVLFAVSGAELWTPVAVPIEAGVASTVVRLPSTSAGFRLHARFPGDSEALTGSCAWSRRGADTPAAPPVALVAAASPL